MRAQARYLTFAFLLVLCACGTLAPKTFNQRMVMAYDGVTFVANTATTLRTAGKLSDKDRDNIANQAQDVKDALDIAGTLKSSDPVGADAKLDATEAGLKALRRYLLAREK